MNKVLSLLILSSFSVSCQNFGKLVLATDLPSKLNEVSGIEYYPAQESIWAVNDSRNPPELYNINVNTGKNVQTIRVKGATNIDWEDLASHPDGSLYIGDFGNNISNRTDLTIYHIATPNTADKRRITPKITSFSFHDQLAFPPKVKDKSYDVESFIYLNEYFYLFTRNRSKHYDGTTKIYKLPAKEGEQVAIFIGEIKTCDDSSDCQITSAAVHHATGTIALLSYNKVWIIKDYIDDNFAHGSIEKIKLKHTSQKESISFKNENELFIADERSKGKGGNLYLLRL
ncbi:MAG: esterase-like activity of phytase family protein [Bacteroidetes bacterium]|nr:esterase-like activity of phytase family protein [Bacteroidota bacterium]